MVPAVRWRGALIYGRADTPEAANQRDAAAAHAESLLAQWAADSGALDIAIREHVGSRDKGDTLPELSASRTVRSRGRLALLVGAGVTAIAVLVALGLLLQPRTPTVPHAELPSSTPLPSPLATTPTPTALSVSPPPASITPPPEDIDLRPDYFEDDIYSVLQVPVDGAPIDNANGRATVDAYGVPLSYVVASGDVFELIAKRFDLGTTYLVSINAVRRENPTELYVGDTLNLGATTILRIGNQNGVVYDFTDRLPEPHMQQD